MDINASQALTAAVSWADAALVLGTWSLVAVATANELRKRRFTQGVLPKVLVPLLTALSFWATQRGLQILETLVDTMVSRRSFAKQANTPFGLDKAYFVIDGAIALFFFIAGQNLLRFPKRIHPHMRPETRRSGIAPRIYDFFASRRMRWFMFAAAPLAPALSLWLHGSYRTEPFWIADIPAALVSFIGMLVLGLGLLREFSREKHEFVSVVCGLSIVVYSVFQLWRVYEPHLGYAQVGALLLKVTLLVALGGYWTLVSEMHRAEKEVGSRWLALAGEQSALVQRVCRSEHKMRGALHDLVKNQLTGARIELSKLRSIIRDKVDDRGLLERSDRSLALAYDSAERILYEYRLVSDLERSLRALCEDVELRAGIRVQYSYNARTIEAGDLADTVFSVAVEAIHNAERHSRSDEIAVALAESQGRLVLTVHDNGRGIEGTAGATGYGIVSMRSRALAVAGDLVISKGRGGRGTLVRLEVKCV